MKYYAVPKVNKKQTKEKWRQHSLIGNKKYELFVHEKRAVLFDEEFKPLGFNDFSQIKRDDPYWKIVKCK